MYKIYATILIDRNCLKVYMYMKCGLAPLMKIASSPLVCFKKTTSALIPDSKFVN